MPISFSNPNGINYVFDREGTPHFSKRDANGNITLAAPADNSSAWAKATAIQNMYLGLNPDFKQVGTSNPWEQMWRYWGKGGGDPDELARYIETESGGKIKVTGEQLAQLANARISGYTGDLPDTVAGLEGFYNKDEIEKIRQRNINAQIKKYYDANNTFGPALRLDTSTPTYSMFWDNGSGSPVAVDTSWIKFNPKYRRTDQVINPGGPLVNPFASATPAAPATDTTPQGAFSPSAADAAASTPDAGDTTVMAPEAPLSAPGGEAKTPRQLSAPGMLSAPALGGGGGRGGQPAARGIFKVGEPNPRQVLRSRGLFSA